MPDMGIIQRVMKALRGGVGAPMGHPGASSFSVVESARTPHYGDPTLAAFRQILLDVSIVATGVRSFVDLSAAASWAFAASEADKDGRYAELAEQALMWDPETRWRQVVKRAVMFRFYGFSLHEWTARLRADGVVTFADISPRPQTTVTEWDIRPDGSLAAVQQQVPGGGTAVIPRHRLLYLVDSTLSMDPWGIGLLRHVVPAAERLFNYKQLEAYAFEADLRGLPVGRAPLSLIRAARSEKQISEEQEAEMLKPVKDFLRHTMRGPRVGVLLDSMTYQGKDEKATPSDTYHWGLDILKGGVGGTPLEPLAAAIRRETMDIAQLLGIEQIMLGSDPTTGGSYALSADKSAALHLQVNSALADVADAAAKDLVNRLWELNSWPEEMIPSVGTEQVRHRDVGATAKALYDMARAGAVLDPSDPVVAEVRQLLGLASTSPVIAEPEPGQSEEEPSGG
jgi:hypothetical protein